METPRIYDVFENNSDEKDVELKGVKLLELNVKSPISGLTYVDANGALQNFCERVKETPVRFEYGNPSPDSSIDMATASSRHSSVSVENGAGTISNAVLEDGVLFADVTLKDASKVEADTFHFGMRSFTRRDVNGVSEIDQVVTFDLCQHASGEADLLPANRTLVETK